MLTALEAVPGSAADPGALPVAGSPPPTVARPDFESFYRTNRDDLYAYVAGMLRDRTAAEDVTALAFERSFRKWRSFDPARGSARGWVFGIARNAALDELRRRGRERSTDREVADGEPAWGATGSAPDGPVEAAERREQRARLDRAVGRLSVADRELVALKFHAGLTNVEIAEITGLSASNVGTRLSRAMTRLREILAGPGEEMVQ